MWVYYWVESQTQAGKDSHVWGGVIWLHSQNTWQVHIYISLPMGEANNSYPLLSAYMCQEPFLRCIQIPTWASQPSIISSILQMRRLRPRQVMETLSKPIVAKWQSWHWKPRLCHSAFSWRATGRIYKEVSTDEPPIAPSWYWLAGWLKEKKGFLEIGQLLDLSGVDREEKGES